MLLGLSHPTAGRAEVFGGDPGDPVIRRRLGYLPGELRLDERATGQQLLDHWARLRCGVDRGYRAAVVERLGLDPSRPVRQLSSGNRRKIGLVGAFMSQPDLLILDEPSNGLDPLVQAEFLTMVIEARDRGATVFLSSHILSEVQRVADRVAVLREGRLVAENSVEALRHTARQPFHAYFDDQVPAAELAATTGVDDLRIDGARAEWNVVGSLQPVLAVLAQHPVRTLVVREPNLEDAFFAIYHNGSHQEIGDDAHDIGERS
jgi:ABC-2 type transport system ATP-binding protein